MDTNEIMNKMKKELQEKIDNNELTLRELDEITYNCAQEFKQAVQKEASAILNKEKELKKKTVHTAKKRTNLKNTIRRKLS